RHKPNETACLIDACGIGEMKLIDLDAKILELDRARKELSEALLLMRGRIAERTALDPIPMERPQAASATSEGVPHEVSNSCPCRIDDCGLCAGDGSD
ncbi:MAG TPA: hypothetical protein VMF58_05100, partial [Rhizomicrobium sp.]|nr:hypothetical protein [Rhizomicrobium sp.]